MRLSTWPAPICLLALLVIPARVAGQGQQKPYGEWSQKEALNILNNSPWGQTQTVTDTSSMFDTGRRLDSGQSRVEETPKIKFHIRFFSAKPIRQATSRLVQISQKGEMNQQLAAQLKALAAADFPDYIIITVVADTSDSGSQMGASASLLDKQTTSELKSQTYLSVTGGQRVFLQEYQPPRKDGLGARFVFPKLLDGKPFISPDSGEILFHSELTGGQTLNMRFKTRDMLFDGKLEY
jgi:hypothetical protein